MPYNILVVDDSSAFREEFKDNFHDYHVIEASNGAQAIEILKKPNEIDLVVLDVMMPGMRGTDVLKEMKQIAPDLAIVIITGFTTASVAIDALKGHADDYLEKPVNIEKAREIIGAILKKREDGLGINSYDIKGKIDRVKRFAERNFEKMVSLDEAATTVGVSPKYLSRIFKEEAGVGFSNYRVQVKIEKAKDWLSKTGYNINQISDKLGYENTESFIRAFKKIAGCTPSEYRKNNRA